MGMRVGEVGRKIFEDRGEVRRYVVGDKAK